ncbi:MAG: hypothetical protein EOL97_16580, partial [Spirochaetia bacterium]|nr:hypothetical protein [Spirochaetia bacterium]
MLGTKSVPIIEYIGEETRNANYRSYMPKYLYKPPFGYPRSSNIDYLRYLSGLPYIEMAIDTIIRKVCASKWNIIPNPRIPKKILDKEFYKDDEFKDNVEFEIQHIRAFLENPNSNPHETFNDVFVEKVIRDLVTLNTAVINKVYNNKMEMVEVIARDGGSFTINPNVFGLLTDREDIISSKKIVKAPEDVSNYLVEMP